MEASKWKGSWPGGDDMTKFCDFAPQHVVSGWLEWTKIYLHMQKIIHPKASINRLLHCTHNPFS